MFEKFCITVSQFANCKRCVYLYRYSWSIIILRVPGYTYLIIHSTHTHTRRVIRDTFGVCTVQQTGKKKHLCTLHRTYPGSTVPTCTGRVPRYYYEGTTCTTFVGSSTDDIRRMYMYVENRYMQSKFNVYTTTLQKSRINSILS